MLHVTRRRWSSCLLLKEGRGKVAVALQEVALPVQYPMKALNLQNYFREFGLRAWNTIKGSDEKQKREELS